MFWETFLRNWARKIDTQGSGKCVLGNISGTVGPGKWTLRGPENAFWETFPENWTREMGQTGPWPKRARGPMGRGPSGPWAQMGPWPNEPVAQ